MEKIPEINQQDRRPIDIMIHSYLRDHRFEGNVIFPAVESIRVLAETVRRFHPGTDITTMTNMRFEKFLYIPSGTAKVSAFSDLRVHANGDITAILMTKTGSGKSSIRRIKEHAALCFPRIAKHDSNPSFDPVSGLEGFGFEISADKIYRDLVPFGPAYHNICNRVFLSRDQAVAQIQSPTDDSGDKNFEPLGSPFPLDAAFHAACVWGQRYARIVAFPVGIEKRIIMHPTQPETTYFTRILPKKKASGRLAFDLSIYDTAGNLFEIAFGVQMRDVSAGRMKPPPWIISDS